MPAVTCGVPSCARPIADHAYVCQSCAADLSSALHDIAFFAEDLTTTLTRQDRMGARGMSLVRTSRNPLPFNVVASDVERTVTTVLHVWVHIVSSETGALLPEETLSIMARWLRPKVTWIRHHESGSDAVLDITGAVRNMRRVIDRPPALVYVGQCGGQQDKPCSCSCHIGGVYGQSCDVAGGCAELHRGTVCTEELYAHAGALTITCRACRTRYDVAQRRQWLLDRVEDQLMTSGALSMTLRYLGIAVADSTVRSYASRGRITQHSQDQRGRPLYRMGDVLEILLGARTS